MKRLCKVFALGMAMLVAAAAQAGPLDWSYSWKVDPIAVPTGEGGNVSMTDLISGSNTGSSTVVATNLVTNSSKVGSLETFELPTSAYKLTMTLKDTTSGQEFDFVFEGHLEGTLSKNSALIDNFFDSPTSISKDLGANSYTVEIGPYVAPGSPENGGQGSIGAKVTVRHNDDKEPDDPQDPQDTPEPSTLLLGGLGLSLLGLAHRRKKA